MLLRPLAFLILLGGCPGPAPDGPTDEADTDTDADTDADGDGYPAGDDCDDDDDAINPGAAESPYDGDDNDCDPLTPDDDLDGDSYPLATDCDDTDASVSPAAIEIQGNGVDDDCDSGTCFGAGFASTAIAWPIPTRYAYGSRVSGFDATADSWNASGNQDSGSSRFDIDNDGLCDE